MSKWNFGGKMKVLSLVCVSVGPRVGQEYLKNDPFWGEKDSYDEAGIQNFHLFLKKTNLVVFFIDVKTVVRI